LKRRDANFTYNFCLYEYCGTFLADEIELITIPTVFLDIGANIGLFSILAAKNEEITKVYAIEPDIYNIPFLEENVDYNRACNVELSLCSFK
jgi:predicted RNA methylase